MGYLIAILILIGVIYVYFKLKRANKDKSPEIEDTTHYDLPDD
jgi:hypothetical protein